MKLGDKVIVSGKGKSDMCYLENTAFIYDLAFGDKYPITVEFLDGTIDAVERDSVRLWDYR